MGFSALVWRLAGLADDGDGGGEALVEDIAHRSWAAIAGIDQLEDAHGGGEGHGGETEQVFGLLDLALLQLEAVLLEGSEDLLYAPAQAVEAHDFDRVWGVFDRQCSQETPEHGLATGRRVDLTGFDEPEGASCVAVPLSKTLSGRRTRTWPARTATMALRGFSPILRRRDGDRVARQLRPAHRGGEEPIRRP